MHIYFVRHGETELNRAHIHQSPNTPLSDEGKTMMGTVGEALRDMNPDLLLASGYTRARESADIIGAHIGLVPQVHPDMYEIVRPSRLHGKSIFTPETFLYVVLSALLRYAKHWRYGDAENVSDIALRAERVLKYIESLRGTHQSVVVVSHSVFISIMIAYMCKNRMLDMRDIIHMFLRSKRMKNGDITHVEYVGNGNMYACNWQLAPTIRVVNEG